MTLKTISPVILSASRSTDIPAFYSEWLFEIIKKGSLEWTNPYNNKNKQIISFEKTGVIVFWTKNAEPIMKYLNELDKRKIDFYFQYTLNDYVKEGLELNVPALEDRIKTFQRLFEIIGKDRMIWRFDPLIISGNIKPKQMLEKIKYIAEKLYGYTKKLVISFIDIKKYKKISNRMAEMGISEYTQEQMEETAYLLQQENKKWGFEIASCAEATGLEKYGIKHNKCIDDGFMRRIFSHNKELMDFLGKEQPGLFEGGGNPLKDKGQRKECGCVVSKDIGQYMPCAHQCKYCYANQYGDAG
jgi:DNA repair photolyase